MRIKDAVASEYVPHGDAEILLAYICGKHRTWILAHGEYMLTNQEEHQWNTFRKRREQDEPIAYIIGEKEFFGRFFRVDHSVLIPRPSTEGLVEMVLAILQLTMTHRLSSTVQLDSGVIGFADIWGSCADTHTIVDVGTGSGCIAITLACALPEIAIIATDISAAALDIARMNAKRHNVADRIQFLHGDLLEPLCHPERSRGAKNPFLVIANPPYIPEGEKLPPDVAAYEPSMALRAGPDGTAVLRPLLKQAHAHPSCIGIIVECREDQIDEKSTEGENARL
ncbi:protein-(glutamine-N5) methyltransferase, release factor-specific [Candidatus Peribacteria bacterium RIFCSPLOWO2_12_FULL_55_15]|nr:MAG: protein-(glutamine-N5) methyltransferase, release factor-specific [Candidatus Peribacteria bacterium RIFCSPHIGHO2_01_FULL_54_22]OGJ62550.1 MAG: protein-(glutamine-N5) methyltransferase, release factor-specific [Candidatus Peribacteria bacterium RIFCSPHIGHO2_02_FULL_55_24]OGJ69103.1 MAG: protein-(glutamine-N5) methyltransferase, release factor-specific [Candidatus Peribacteria bacterium RIFCSPLOWO2_01_FULL_54_110]OGJ69683.1 MAG: protein-(glutamine-N5) methyltransferase, release factor-spe